MRILLDMQVWGQLEGGCWLLFIVVKTAEKPWVWPQFCGNQNNWLCIWKTLQNFEHCKFCLWIRIKIGSGTLGCQLVWFKWMIRRGACDSNVIGSDSNNKLRIHSPKRIIIVPWPTYLSTNSPSYLTIDIHFIDKSK